MSVEYTIVADSEANLREKKSAHPHPSPKGCSAIRSATWLKSACLPV